MMDFAGLEVAVVENSRLAQDGLVMSLEQLGCRVVWAAAGEEEARTAAADHLPSIVFVDLRLLNKNDDYQPGWQLIKHLRQVSKNPDFAAIILSGTPMIDEIALEAVRIGCSYLVKEDLGEHAVDILAAALLAARSGSVLLTNEVANHVETLASRADVRDLLSDAEWKVLRFVAAGLTNKDIAHRLFVEVATIKTHVSHILRKLDVSNRHEAARWYDRHANDR